MINIMEPSLIMENYMIIICPHTETLFMRSLIKGSKMKMLQYENTPDGKFKFILTPGNMDHFLYQLKLHFINRMSQIECIDKNTFLTEIFQRPCIFF